MSGTVRSRMSPGRVPPVGPRGPAGPTAVRVLVVCFLVVLLDGLDTTSIAFVAPVLRHDWGLAAAAFTPAFVATSLGAVLGYLGSGPLAERFGPRTVGLASVVAFGLGSLATAGAGDIGMLSALRLVSGLGLGGALPIAIAVAANVVPARRGPMAAMLAGTGFSAGSVLGGLGGGPLMATFGPGSVFVMGGILPIALLTVLGRVLPGRVGERHERRTNPVASLFRNGLGFQTAFIWAFAFLIFLGSYGLAFWIPTALTDFGFSPDRTALGAAAFGMGGLLGNLGIMAIIGRAGIRAVLALASGLAIACIAVLSLVSVPSGVVLPLIAGAGAGMITGSVGLSALAVAAYPPELRTTGVGWAAAVGRIGSILGPGVGGALLSLDWPMRSVMLTAIVPIGVALLALGLIVALEGHAGRDPALATNVP
jgi:AAHS family 4-hydroxybenzoate transporter-like MFS transporter